MSHHHARRLGRRQLLAVLAAICCLLGIVAVTQPAMATSSSVSTSAVAKPTAKLRTALAVSSNCRVPKSEGIYKTSGSGTHSDPCRYNVHAYGYEVSLQKRNLQVYNRTGQSILVSFAEGYTTTHYVSADWPYASKFYIYLHVVVQQIECLDGSARVSCGYLHIGVNQYDFGKNNRTVLTCHVAKLCNFYATGGMYGEGLFFYGGEWTVGGSKFQTASKYMMHFGKIDYISGIVDGYYAEGERSSNWWLARVHVDY